MRSLADRINGYPAMRAEMKARFIAAAHQGLSVSKASPETKQRLRDRIPETCAKEVERWLVAVVAWLPMVLAKEGIETPPELVTDETLFDYLEQTGEATAQGVRLAYAEHLA